MHRARNNATLIAPHIYKNHSNMQRDVIPNSLHKRVLESDFKAMKYLQMISQPPGIPLTNLYSYDYEDTAGKGTTLYIADNGADLSHPVSCMNYFTNEMELICSCRHWPQWYPISITLDRRLNGYFLVT